MREKLLLNDLHIGVQRSGGTTPASAIALREHLLGVLEAFIMGHLDKDLVLNGDVFDTFAVPMTDLLALYHVLAKWLIASAPATHDDPFTSEPIYEAPPEMILGRGNHDPAKDNSKMSSFDFLCHVLVAQFPNRVTAVFEPKMIFEGIYMIPHVANQDLFNLELERVPAEAKLVLIHANYDNHFTVESDHSLNVSPEQAKKLADAGCTLVFGHEHQAREELGGAVVITGNQWPSSVADCLHNPGGLKNAHVIEANFDLTPLLTWSAAQSFGEVPWDCLDSTAYEFVRVIGTATTEEAGAVVAAIAKYRQQSKAFVVTNAVKVEGLAEMADLPQSMEDVKAFDVLGYLFEQLASAQVDAVKALMAKRDQPMRQAA
jgi:hypothetical protein